MPYLWIFSLQHIGCYNGYSALCWWYDHILLVSLSSAISWHHKWWYFSDGDQDAVMLDTQSTFALPNRLTQIALYPNLNQYLRDVDNEGTSVCQASSWTVRPKLFCFQELNSATNSNLTFLKIIREINVSKSADTKRLWKNAIAIHLIYQRGWICHDVLLTNIRWAKRHWKFSIVYLLVIFKRSSKNLWHYQMAPENQICSLIIHFGPIVSISLVDLLIWRLYQQLNIPWSKKEF